MMKRKNKQVGGSHYEILSIEPVEAFIHYHLDWFQSEIIKYCSRFHNKNGKQDLDKAYQVSDLAMDLGLGQLELFPFEGDDFLIQYCSQFKYEDIMKRLMIAVINHDYVIVKKLINELIEKYYG